MTSDADGKGVDVLLAHYVALKKAATNINGYRQQGVALTITSTLPPLEAC